ncbi:DUF6090 family protein [Ulvibacterium sp.]|uniref:DUF6090 family protein n=1 Tax=Ulvibacterium sp. TaxID=2665914 RepID=UPI0026133253|nr:DUF6090 family protein [Ulvibacterium sp.]
MVKLLRKIRQQFLFENKTGRYFKYAIGEIVLLVIGILIALQINNWNENRKIRQQEEILLTDIHTEFKYNMSELKSNLTRYDQARKNLARIIDLFPIDYRTIELDTLAFLLERTHFDGNYDYSNTSLEKIRNSSSYDIISNVELRNLLLQWEVLLADYIETESWTINHHEERYSPTLGNNFPRPYIRGFKDPRANLQFLGSIEFEGLIQSRRGKINGLFRLVRLDEKQNNIMNTIERIIELSNGD